MNYLQKPYTDLKLYLLVIMYVILVSSLELPVIFHEHFKVAPEEFFVADYQVVYLVTLHLHFYIESLYTDIIPNQNKFSSVSLQYSYKSL